MKVFRRWAKDCVLLVACLSAGCSKLMLYDTTFTERGSVYAKTGEIKDLYREPTLDIGYEDGQWDLYKWSWRVPLYDADGHGIFDVPVAVSEEACFLPFVVVSGATAAAMLPSGLLWKLAYGERDVTEPPSVPGYIPLGLAFAFGGIGFACQQVAHVSWIAGMGCVEICDVVIHDVPITIIGKPVGAAMRMTGIKRDKENVHTSPANGDRDKRP